MLIPCWWDGRQERYSMHLPYYAYHQALNNQRSLLFHSRLTLLYFSLKKLFTSLAASLRSYRPDLLQDLPEEVPDCEIPYELPADYFAGE